MRHTIKYSRAEVKILAVFFCPLLILALHLCCIFRYGIFRDELYYLACSKRLAWGYVDHPPLSICVLYMARQVGGDSLLVIRLPAALAIAITALLTSVMARKMGGGPFAQLLAGLAVTIAPVYLVVGHLYSMNGLDVLLWTTVNFLFMQILSRDGTPANRLDAGCSTAGIETDPASSISSSIANLPFISSSQRGAASNSLWLAMGLVLGLGLLNKWSVLWLITGLFLGLLCTSHRRMLLHPGPWLSGLVAFSLFTPHLFWQVRHHWPTLEFMHNALAFKLNHIPMPQFMVTQIAVMNPINVPIWLAGLSYCLLSQEGKRWRPMGIAFLTVVVILLINGKSRANYLSPAYPPLLAMGSYEIERRWTRKKRIRKKRRPWGKFTLWQYGGRKNYAHSGQYEDTERSQKDQRVLQNFTLIALALFGIATLPFSLPILPIRTIQKVLMALPFNPPVEEKGPKSKLQGYSDMLGWQEMVSTAASVYRSLPPEDRAKCVILTSNYGEAGAIDRFGPSLGLPRAICGQNNYWLWGPGKWSGEVAIVVNKIPHEEEKLFAYIHQAATVHAPLSVPEEQNAPIYIVRSLKAPVSDFWPRIKRYW